MELKDLVTYLDTYLEVEKVPDYPNALNGLQVESRGEIRRIATAVDASEASIAETIRRGCDLLIVHHGLFWDGNRPVSGRRYRRLQPLLEKGIALYSAHLPLDVHPEVGNNVVLARELGIELEGHFAEYQGHPLGVWGTLEIGREALTARLDEVLGGRVKLLPGGSEHLHRLGVLTGAGGSLIGAAIAAGLDGFITGEGVHHSYFDALEGGINVYYGGHYATETWGVRALGSHISDRFGIPVEFLDLPTGL
jgi:dinuclear metal center YbgI/SA1388 family protein